MKKLSTLLLFTIILISSYSQISVTATAGTAGPTAYTTLKGAFDAVNAGTHRGVITIAVTGNTTETASASLNASGSGSSSYSGVTISPSGGVGVTISGSIAGALITLNGADNVTIDGLNSGGNSLTLENQHTGTTSSTVLFQTTANTNTITRCGIKGSTGANTAYAVVTFRGGSTNTISYSDIGPSGSNKPWACIVSSTGTNNSETISNCNLYDYYAASAYQAGIYLNLSGVNSTWTITNNSFYQTTSVASTAGTVNGIYMGSGNGYIISGNYFGGSSASCGGTAMTYTGTLYSMSFLETSSSSAGVNNAVVNSITYNTIANINVTSSNATIPNSLWDTRFSAFFIKGGKHSIRNNTIGSQSGTGNIVLDNGAISSPYRILQLNGVSSVWSTTGSIIQAFNNNTIGAITINSTNADLKFIKSELNNGGDICQLDSICNNSFGSEVASNISIPGANTGLFYLTYLQTTSNITPTIISGNSFQNITRGGTGGLYAIFSMAMSSVTNNVIKNISTASTAGVRGIYLTYYSSAYTIKNNFIDNLTSTSASAIISGIYTDNTGVNAVSNNIVHLGTGDNISGTKYGLYLATGNVYYNTVYIGGTGTSGAGNSYAVYRYTNSGTLNMRNNIFCNARSNSSGATPKHYAVYLAGTTSVTINYNDYYVSAGNGAMLGYLTSDRSTIAAWRTATAQDGASYNTNPAFASPGSASGISYIPSASLPAVTGTGITADYLGVDRSASTPTMGALEYSIVWNGTADNDWNNASNWSPSIPSATDVITFNSTASNHILLDQDRTVAGINFNGSGKKIVLGGFNLTLSSCFNSSTQSYIQTNSTGRVRSTIANGGSFSFACGNSAYNPVTVTNNSGSDDLFSVLVLDEVYANGSSGATISGERVRRTWDISKTNANAGSGVGFVFNWNAGETTGGFVTPKLVHHNGSGWVRQATGTTGSNSYSLSGYTGTFSPFAITDDAFLLPVQMTSFRAIKNTNAVQLDWTTSAEMNVNRFEVQHSTNLRDWIIVGSQQASGNSVSDQHYNFIHANPADGVNYYRLQIKDIDNFSSWSRIVSVSFTSNSGLVLYPNPVVNGFAVLRMPAEGNVIITNAGGIVVKRMLLQAGDQVLDLKGLTAGVYQVQLQNQLIRFIIQ